MAPLGKKGGLDRINRYRWIQRLKWSVPGALYLVVLILIATQTATPPVVVGSLIGVLPVLLAELREEFVEPHLVVEDVDVVLYPNRIYVLDGTDEHGPNAIGVKAHIRNVGLEPAKDCTVRLASSEVDQSFATRWEREDHPISVELAPNEVHTIDAFWVTLGSNDLATAGLEDRSGPVPPRPGNYSKTTRPEVPYGRQEFSLELKAANMDYYTVPLSLTGSKATLFPEDLLGRAEEWELTRAKKAAHRCAIWYSHGDEHLLEVSEGITIYDSNARRELSEILDSEVEARSEIGGEEYIELGNRYRLTHNYLDLIRADHPRDR